MDSVPENGTEEGQFFYREENPFRELDESKAPQTRGGEDELETSDLQFKALKQDVLLQMFDSAIQSENDSIAVMADLFAVGNRTGYFACGGQTEFWYGETKLLHNAFDVAKPKTNVSFQGGHKLDLPEAPTHVRFTSDEKFVIVSMPTSGILYLDCDKLQEGKSRQESTRTSISTPPLLDIISNPSPQKARLVAYITRPFPQSPYGELHLYDLATEMTMKICPNFGFTCATFSHDGEILMACTKTGEILYHNISNSSSSVPTRCPPPPDLPELDGHSWWIVQGLHWIDSQHQLVIYNPFTHPYDEPVHDYQAYIISSTSRLSTLAPYSFEFTKLPTPPVDAFGNNALRPWFRFQQLHDWQPGISDLVICSVTAGSDIGLLGRELDNDSQWRVWTIEDENRRATVPYNMEKNEETIVMGMQLDFTGTKRLEKPLYPDEDPAECDALPILWVLNNEGQLAGWNIFYIPGMKARKRAMAMTSIESVDHYWQTQRQEISMNIAQMTDEERKERASWEKTWHAQYPETAQAQPPSSKPEETSQKTESSPTPVKPPPQILSVPSPPSPSPSQPAFGQSSQLGASTTFGRPGQLGGVSPGQSGLYAGFGPGLNAGRQGHVFGQSSNLGAFAAPPAPLGGGGFAKYTPPQTAHSGGFLSGQPSEGGSFLSGGAPKTGSFLQAGSGHAGSFLQGGQTGSFLQDGQSGSFLSGGQTNAFSKTTGDQGFAKFASTTTGGFGTTQPPSTDQGFLGPKPTTPITNPFDKSSSGPLSQRTQSLNTQASRSESYDLVEDESGTESETDESDVSESESEADDNVRVDALNFGDGDFALSLDTKSPSQDAENAETSREPIAALKEDTTHPDSPSDSFVELGLSAVSSPEEENELLSKQVPPTKTAIQSIQPAPSVVTAGETKTSPEKPPAQHRGAVPGTPEISRSTMTKDNTPPRPAIFEPRNSIPVTPTGPINPQRTPTINETAVRSASPASKNKVELRPFVPVGGQSRIASKLDASADLSQAFRLVIEQVTVELEKLSENTKSLAEYVEYQSEQTGVKTAEDLEHPDEWTFADLNAISRIVEGHNKSVEDCMKDIPKIDEAIQELEKSLKKMEAKKMEIDRFVRVVKDPEIRESLHSRKLAPDFARQQKDIRHSFQEAEQGLRDLASALIVLKAELADEKGSFGVQAPTTASVYRVVNNVFSRLQILSAKITTLENKIQSVRGLRLGSPAVESPRSGVAKTKAAPSTPVNKVGVMGRPSPSRSSPRSRISPGARGSPLRKTMLDERVDPWETEEIIRDLEKKREFKRKIASILKGTSVRVTQVTI